MSDPLRPTDDQLEFPFPVYAEREDLLKQLQFARGAGVNAGTLYAVLCEIAKYQESWQTQATIAANTKLSKPTVQRAIKVLGKCHLITKERKWFRPAKQVRNFHRVNWTEVRRRVKASNVYRPKHQFEALRDGPKHQVDVERTIKLNLPKHQLDADQSISLMHKQQVLVKGEIEPTRTEPEVVVSDEFAVEDSVWTTDKTQQVCDRLRSLNCTGDVAKAVDAAKRRGWSFAKALEVIEHREPNKPAWLFNWFINDGSWERHLASKDAKFKSIETGDVNHQRGDAMTREQQREEKRRVAVAKRLNKKFYQEQGRLATEAEVMEALERGCA